MNDIDIDIDIVKARTAIIERWMTHLQNEDDGTLAVLVGLPLKTVYGLAQQAIRVTRDAIEENR